MFRPKLSGLRNVTASEHLLDIVISQMESRDVEILSAHNNKLLAGSAAVSQLFIFNSDGSHLSTINANVSDNLVDAAWTPRGNIIFATSRDTVVIIDETGRVVKTTVIRGPRRLSVSHDNFIYLSVEEQGLYQLATDDDTWTFVVDIKKNVHRWYCRLWIKVTVDDCVEFWTIQTNMYNDPASWTYTLQSSRSHFRADWMQIYDRFRENCKSEAKDDMIHDGNLNIFLSDIKNKAVHLLSVDNRNQHCQLLSSDYISKEPVRLTIDFQHHLLYVGQRGGVVGVFNLIYDPSI